MYLIKHGLCFIVSFCIFKTPVHFGSKCIQTFVQPILQQTNNYVKQVFLVCYSTDNTKKTIFFSKAKLISLFQALVDL